MRNKITTLLFIMIAICLYGCGDTYQTKDIPSVPREFRAAWVATVSNINWPSKPGLSVDQQKQEAIAILDMLEETHFNAVILQVRPQCDALYSSELEPWSYYLTGRQGQRPEPYYDPLGFWIEQSHDRGMELHAWLNPYRAHTGKSSPCPSSVVHQKPELVRRLENGTYWLDPGLRQTQDYSYNVVMDIVRRYDVDGIHFDDYFYPYPSYNNGEDFPDDSSWQSYRDKGGDLSQEDWRRHAVNTFIQRVYKGIKKEKAQVKFGLSPFGIWRPGHPKSISGLDQYNVLYADAKLWINEGWVDYWTPQLYWPIHKISQSFPVLLSWWQQQNHKKRHLWPGINVSHGDRECINQIMVTRGVLPDNPGTVHWSVGSIQNDKGRLAKELLKGPYAAESLVPASPWLDNKRPSPPVLGMTEEDNRWMIHLSHPAPGEFFRWIVYTKQNNRWTYDILNRKEHTYSLPKGMEMQIAVSVIDRIGNESKRFSVILNK